MRHFQQGAARAAKWASVPIINGGDEQAKHRRSDRPVHRAERKGTIDGLTWLAVGDMRMRTMHSLGYTLTSSAARSPSFPRRTCR